MKNVYFITIWLDENYDEIAYNKMQNASTFIQITQ